MQKRRQRGRKHTRSSSIDRKTPGGAEESTDSEPSYLSLYASSDEEDITKSSLLACNSTTGVLLSDSGDTVNIKHLSINDSDDDIELIPPTTKRSKSTRPIIISDSEESENDFNREDSRIEEGDILVLNDSRASWRPKERPKLIQTDTKPDGSQVTPNKGRITLLDKTSVQTPVSIHEKGTQAELPEYSIPNPIPKQNRDKSIKGSEKPILITATTPAGALINSSPKKGRVSKKVLEQEKHERLVKFAQSLFDALNDSVFNNGLSKETALIWSNRLRFTAGRARWDGRERSSIELATKVLDCEERICNTLPHEMCHLASWLISRVDDGHGPIWTSWASKVMEIRPDLKITKKHDFPINYKYQWKCDNSHCGKIFGRHSKSIDPMKHICPICRSNIVPLFETRPRKNKIMSGAPKEDSSVSPDKLKQGPTEATPSKSNDSDEDVQALEKLTSPRKIQDSPSKQSTKTSVGRDINRLVEQMLVIDLTSD